MIEKKIAEFPIVYINQTARLAIGWGAHETVGNECKALKIKKALIITTGLKGTGIVEEINSILKAHGTSTEIYNKVTSNPKDYQVMEAYEIFKEAKCDGIVSVGGGSSHDCGKGVRVVAANNGENINKFAVKLDPPWMQEMAKRKPVTIPQVSINTTAGTGAEGSQFACITDVKNRSKNLIVVPGIIPSIGIVDPILIRMVPANIAAWSGWDAMAHGIEAYVTKVNVPHAAPMLLKCVELVAKNIREFTANRMNQIACENMCWAESMGGLGIGLGSGAGLIHGCGHQISAITDAHHGFVNAVLTIPMERYNFNACPEKFANLAKAIGIDTTGMTTIQAADKWFDETERILKDLNIKSGHLKEQVGLQQKDLKHIATIFMNDFCREGNPAEITVDGTVKLLEGIL